MPFLRREIQMVLRADSKHQKDLLTKEINKQLCWAGRPLVMKKKILRLEIVCESLCTFVILMTFKVLCGESDNQ